jgi:hypothetical protein
LVEGGSARPESLVFRVEDQQRWKDHLTKLGISTEADGSKLVIIDPDGLKIFLE